MIVNRAAVTVKITIRSASQGICKAAESDHFNSLIVYMSACLSEKIDWEKNEHHESLEEEGGTTDFAHTSTYGMTTPEPGASRTAFTSGFTELTGGVLWTELV